MKHPKETGPIGKNVLIERIASTTGVPRDAVRMVLNCQQDIAVEEVTSKGSFKIPGVASIQKSFFKGSPGGGLNSEPIPPGWRLTASVAGVLRKTFNVAQDNGAVVLSRENWREEVEELVKNAPEGSRMIVVDSAEEYDDSEIIDILHQTYN